MRNSEDSNVSITSKKFVTTSNKYVVFCLFVFYAALSARHERSKNVPRSVSSCSHWILEILDLHGQERGSSRDWMTAAFCLLLLLGVLADLACLMFMQDFDTRIFEIPRSPRFIAIICCCQRQAPAENLDFFSKTYNIIVYVSLKFKT